MEGITLAVVHTVGGGIGLLIAGPIFGCRVHPVTAFVAAAISGVVYWLLESIPGVGGAASLLVFVLIVGYWGTGDWQDALLTCLVARGVVLIVGLYWTLGPGAAA